MKVVVLQPSYEGSQSIIAQLDSKRSLGAWMPPSVKEVEYVYIKKTTVNRQIRSLKGDVFINLCDGAWDEDVPGEDVIRALEKEKKTFTGSHSAWYDPTKEEMKMFCYYWDVKTPAYVIAHDSAGIEKAANTLKFPCFVKHEHGYNSVGITEKSKVNNVDELHEQANIMIKQYDGAIIEEFIEGREFSVLVSSNPNNDQDPYSYRPVECVFDDTLNFKTFDYKWKGTRNPWVSVQDDALAKRLTDMTKALYVAAKASGYARSDIRMDKDGELYLLEINPNCSIFYPDDDGSTADVILQWDVGKSVFMQRIIEFAFHRSNAAKRKYNIERIPGLGNSMVAAVDFAPGDVIQRLEESPHYLVTRGHVAKYWDAKNRDFFDHFAYPLTDELFAVWDPNPYNWSPINHSCDPNAWLEGLNLVARRPITKGEYIVMDYGTMYTQNPVNFACKCGAVAVEGEEGSGCRTVWKGDDYLQPWFIKRYGDHVTDYVRQARKYGLKAQKGEHVKVGISDSA